MDSSLHVVYFTLLVLVAVAHAALTPNDYWKMMLPNTPMPTSILDLLKPGVGVGMETLAKHGDGVRKEGIDIAYFNYDIAYFSYDWLSTTQSQTPDWNVFFLEKDLLQGTKTKQDFTRKSSTTAFAPRPVASAVPFSSEKFPVILGHFSTKPNSTEAHVMMNTLRLCENKAGPGEIKYCATSLESMIDFTTSALNTHGIHAMSSTFTKKGATKQEFVVTSPARRVRTVGDNVACHPLSWPHAVFYCHRIPATKLYMVTLLGKEDGAKVDAIAVCHVDTSAWDPRHVAFQVVKVRPGTAPICHFIALGGILFAHGAL